MLGSGPLLRRRGKKVDLIVQNVRENQVQALVPRKMQAILCLSYLRVFSFCVSLLFLSPVYFWSFRPRSSPSYIYAFSPLPLPPFYGVIHLNIEPILLNLGWRSMPSRKSHKEHTPWSWPWSLGTELVRLVYASFPRKIYLLPSLAPPRNLGCGHGKRRLCGVGRQAGYCGIVATPGGLPVLGRDAMEGLSLRVPPVLHQQDKKDWERRGLAIVRSWLFVR